MTQAFNLSQLANKVNTSGQLDASTGLVNIIPVANGGTGRSSVTTGRLLLGAGTGAMTLLAGTNVGDGVTWNGTSWSSGSLATNPPLVVTFVAPGTYTKPATLAGIKVTVIGGGGNGGTGNLNPAPVLNPIPQIGGNGGGGGTSIRWMPAPSIPAPVSITAGSGTNSFGAYASATGGGTGSNAPTAAPGASANGGAGSGGAINLSGQPGYSGGDSFLGFGGSPVSKNGIAYGGGGIGGTGTIPTPLVPGGTGASGIIIIEEFY